MGRWFHPCGQAEQAKQAIDTRSIHSIPESYGEKSLSQGTLKTLTYSSRTYDSNNTVATKKATVYLHHGYSADKKYNILYLMHGYGGDENTFLGSETSPRYLKRMLDHMISAGDIDPLIVVTPTLTWGSGDYYSTMGPMTLTLAKMMKINPVPILLGQIFASNIGGTMDTLFPSMTTPRWECL